MIIVSQDKMEIINLDRVTEISVSGNCICVTDRIEQKNGYVIATYKTEERAKEVLQEIIRQKAMFEVCKSSTDERARGEILYDFAQENIILDIYIMPED